MAFSKTLVFLFALVMVTRGQNCTAPCDKCFTGDVSSNWNSAGNWIDQNGQPGQPTASDLACFRNLEDGNTSPCGFGTVTLDSAETADELRLECANLQVAGGGSLSAAIVGSSGRDLTMAGGSLSGSITLSGGSADFRLNSGTVNSALSLNNGASMSIGGSGSKTFSPSAAFTTGSTLTFAPTAGTTTFDQDATFGAVAWDSTETIIADGAAVDFGDLTASTAVNIEGQGGGSIAFNDPVFPNGLSATGLALVNNADEWAFTGGAVSLLAGSSYTQTGTALLLVDGVDVTCADDDAMNINGGEFYMSGGLGCDLTAGTGATVSPKQFFAQPPPADDLPDLVSNDLTITGSFTAQTGSLVKIGVDSSGSASKIVASGSVAISGAVVEVEFYSTPSRTPEPFPLIQAGTLTGEWGEDTVVGHNPAFHCPEFIYSVTGVDIDVDCDGVDPNALTLTQGLMLAGGVLAVGGAIGGAVIFMARRGSQRSGRSKSGRQGSKTGGGGGGKKAATPRQGSTQQHYAKGAPKAEKKPEKFRPGRKASTGKERKGHKKDDMGDMIATTMDAQPNASRFDKQRKHDWAKKDGSNGKRKDSAGKRDRKDQKKKDKKDEEERDQKGMSVATKVFKPTDSQLNALWADNVTPEDRARGNSNAEKGGRRRGSSGANKGRPRKDSKQKASKAKGADKTLSAITIAPPNFG